jgi:hypothetical protein
MPNVPLTHDMIAEEALMLLDNESRWGTHVHRGYEKEFDTQPNGYTKGSSIRVRKPSLTEVTDGVVMVRQDQVEGYTNVTVDKRKHIAIGFSSADMSLKISDFADRFLRDPIIKLKDQIERDVAANYKYLYHGVGTPGQTIDSFADFNAAATLMTELAINGERRAILSPKDFGALQNNFTGQFNTALANGQVVGQRKIPVLSEIPSDESANAPRHTVGVATGTPRVNGAGQSVTYEASPNTFTQTLNTDGWTNSTTGILKAGDQFTIPGVYAVNPVNGQVLDDLQRFVVWEDANSGASTGPAALVIAPKIITSGPYRTVSAAPADDALITVLGTGGTTYRQNVFFGKGAMHLTMVPVAQLEDGRGKLGIRKTYNGMSVLMTPVVDATNFFQSWRLDVLYGTGVLDPRLGLRAYGSP